MNVLRERLDAAFPQSLPLFSRVHRASVLRVEGTGPGRGGTDPRGISRRGPLECHPWRRPIPLDMISDIIYSITQLDLFGGGEPCIAMVRGSGWGMKIEQRVRDSIRDIAQRRNNVMLGEIEWVMKKLSETYKTRQRPARHGILFGIENLRFMVNCHNPGSKQVKSYSVDDFIDAMEDLGLYEEEAPTNE